MASGKSGIWAIDIGSNSLKALHLRPSDHGPEVVGFDFLEHARILNQDGVTADDRQEAIGETLHKFVEKHEPGQEQFALAVSGQNSFARFIKLPPVEKKRIPQIVQFEAVQQIPFDINEVEWDWQLTDNPDSPDAEVGIFAVKNELVAEIMSHFARERLGVSLVQLSPMAMYNYAMYDRKEISSGDKATVILDMGTDNTTLVVCNKNSVWQRSIRIGGNTFTEAIAEAFKLDFDKAEKLKRTAMMSKYMRQIFTAMRPVYSDLGSEVQRSLGFYSSSGPGREKGFSKVVGMGGGMKLQGVTKYLQQTLNVPVTRPESFEQLPLASDASMAKFHENVGDFGIVYGLGVQALAEPKIGVNLLPRKMARAMTWARKAKYFTAAACLLLAVSVLSLVNVQMAKARYNSSANRDKRAQFARVEAQAKKAMADLETITIQETPLKATIDKETALFRYREVVPRLNQMIVACLPNATTNPTQAGLYEAFDRGDAATVSQIPRAERKQLFLTRLTISFAESLDKAQFAQGGTRRTITTTTGGGMEGMDRNYMRSRPGQMGREDRGIRDRMTVPMDGTAGGAGATAAPDAVGFVVLIEGYTPYQNFDDLLDPTGVKADPSRWGLVTRLENLSKMKEFQGTEFDLFQKGNIKHFKLETGAVDLGNSATPLGIGLLQEIVRVTAEQQAVIMGTDRTGLSRASMGTQTGPDRVFTEKVLLDPMTREEISKTYSLILPPDLDTNPALTEKDLGKVKTTSFGDPQFIMRDHWFKVNFKLAWKGAPKSAAPAAPMLDDESGIRSSPVAPVTKPAKSAKPSKLKSKRNTGSDF
jgi:type IV pilus assembly protein PilM